MNMAWSREIWFDDQNSIRFDRVFLGTFLFAEFQLIRLNTCRVMVNVELTDQHVNLMMSQF